MQTLTNAFRKKAYGLAYFSLKHLVRWPQVRVCTYAYVRDLCIPCSYSRAHVCPYTYSQTTFKSAFSNPFQPKRKEKLKKMKSAVSAVLQSREDVKRIRLQNYKTI